MADKIKLVQNDNLPNIEVALTYADGAPFDLTDATVVVVYFRDVGGTDPLATLPCTKKNPPGADGRILFSFPGASLAVEPGPYEGEIECTFSTGQKQTVYDVLKFNVRAQFA